jgi:predicted DNA-binding protein with PD1-like motif
VIFRHFGNRYVVRIDRGEEIVESLKAFLAQSGVLSGWVSGIGAVYGAEVARFVAGTKQYIAMKLEGEHEITALNGNIAVLDGKPFLHLHISLTDTAFRGVGGHLKSAVVSGTCEVIIDVLEGYLKREFNEKEGLNLIA